MRKKTMMNTIKLGQSEGVKDANYWAEEHKKCMEDPYYFHVNYNLINGQKPTITREEWNLQMTLIKARRKRY